MINKINVEESTCKHCHKYGKITTIDSEANEFEVCYNCGQVALRQPFNARDFLLKIVRKYGDDRKFALEQLENALTEKYGWLSMPDIEMLASLMVQNLYDDVNFEILAERQAFLMEVA